MMVSNNSKHHIYHRFDQNNPLVLKNIHQKISNATNFTVKRKLFDNSTQEKDFPVRKLSGTFNKIKTKLVQIITRFTVSTEQERLSIIRKKDSLLGNFSFIT